MGFDWGQLVLVFVPQMVVGICFSSPIKSLRNTEQWVVFLAGFGRQTRTLLCLVFFIKSFKEKKIYES
jgi:hypothetical protein